MTITTDVLIIGAGPTGLTLAVDLRRRGVDCLVIERAVEPHEQSRGKGLQPRTLEVLDDLGVIDDILQYGEWRQQVSLYKDRKRLALLPVGLAEPRADLPYPNIVMLPQWRTCTILADRLRELDGDVQHGWTLEDFEQSDAGVSVSMINTTGDHEEVEARFMVGADGGHSRVREQLGISFDGESRPSARYLLGDVIIDDFPPQSSSAISSHAWFGSDGSFLGLAGLPGTGTWQIGASIGLDDELEPSVETFQRLLDERTGRDDLPVVEATWLSDFTVNVRLAETYRRGRVFIAGDAAHVHPPTGGQGMNTGIQDAYNLGWKLGRVLEGRADISLLDTYTAERRPVAAGVLEKSTDILDVVMSDNPIVATLIQRVVLPILSVPAINRALLRRVSQIDVGYRGGPLAEESGGRGLRPGDRMPDAPVTDLRAGRTVRLHDLLRGAHFVALSWTEDPIEGDDPRHWRIVDTVADDGGVTPTLHDHQRALRRTCRPRQDEVLLIRPDGYLAWRSPATELHSAWPLSQRTGVSGS